jgi:hypothetical protein
MLVPLLSGLIAALLVYLLSRSVRPTTAQHEGRRWVEFGPAYKLLVAAFFPLSAFVSYAASQASADQQTLAGLIALCFWLGTIYLAYGFYFVQINYDEDSIYQQSPLRGQRRIPWDAISAIDYSTATQSYTLKSEGYGDVSISPLADGCAALVEAARSRLDGSQRGG